MHGWLAAPGRGRLPEMPPNVVNRLKGKVAMVTGGARGIGYAIAQRLVEEGASVAVLALHPDSAARAVHGLAARGGKAIAIAGDVSDERDVKSAVDEAVAAFGRLDIMVNNAATIAIGALVETTTETWDQVMEVNLRGVFLG